MNGYDYTTWRFWFDVFQFVLTAAVGLYVWLSTRERVTRSRIEKMEREMRMEIKTIDEKAVSKVTKLGERLTSVESAGASAPNHSDLSKIHDRINDVSASVSTIAGEMKSMRRGVDLIHQHLLAERKS